MNMSNKSARRARRTAAAGATRTRAQRTATRFACESLEGRNLLTSFAGAGPMMMGHDAAMTGRGGPGLGDIQRFDRPDGFNSPGDGSGSLQAPAPGVGSTQADAATTTPDATGSNTTTTTATTPGGPVGWTPSLAHDDRADGNGGRAGAHSDDRGGFGAMAADRGGWDQSDGDPSGRADQRMGDLGGRADGGDLGGDRDLPVMGPGGGSGQGSMGDGPGSGNSAASAALTTDLTKLRTDEQAIHDKSQVTPALQAAVRKDLQAIDAAKTTAASATATQQLKTDEQAILGSAASGSTTATSTATSTSTPATPPSMPTAPPTLTDAQKTTLQNDHDAILLSEGVSQGLIDQLAKDQLAVRTASNFTDADQATLDADHKAIQADLAAPPTQSADPTATSTATATATTTTATATTAMPTAPAAALPTTAPTTAPPTDPTTATTAPPTMPTTAAPVTDPTTALPTATTTASPTMPTMPTTPPTTMMGSAIRNHHRSNGGGSTMHFMHQVSTADAASGTQSGATDRLSGGNQNQNGFGSSRVGRGRQDFRR